MKTYNYCYKTRVNVFAFHLLDKGKCMIIFTRTNFGAEAQLSFCQPEFLSLRRKNKKHMKITGKIVNKEANHKKGCK